MDSTKTAIKSLVLDLRKTLEADLETGLRRYGISAQKLRELSELKHLDDHGIAMRIRMEEAIKHEMRRGGSKGETKAVDGGEKPAALAEAVHWFVREVAFTHLNRLAALKVMEVRRLIPEIIQTRPEYGERSRALRDYRAAHPTAAEAADGGLEAAIQEICRQVYPEFHILFDVGDADELRQAPANSLLWPSTPALKACIEKINALDAKVGRSGPPAHAPATAEQSLWAEDEIIGWIYQFYNAEEKVAIRQRGKPTRPAEVAVINQFFTPRWIVKFLVDNTLGRLWLEMHPDSPRVREKCDYLVPEPSPPAPLPALSTASAGEGGGSDGLQLDMDSPVNNPSAAPRRPAKKPQEIRLIDPACGTMHFGHYAFEVFQEIYRDARQQGWASGAEALSEAEIPAAILRGNLYGVDIDLRAVQLAALSLFIKAKTAHPEAKIERLNLVVADAYLPQGAVRDDFLAQYKGEPLIQKAFREVFASLDNVAEVGSLLRVEERFRQVLQAGGYSSAAETLASGRPRQGKMETLDGKLTAVRQASFGELAPGWQPEYTIEQMLNHLREFARHALQEHDLNAQLFAAETEKSVALLDVFLHEYDVVVMNPPYGGTTGVADSYLQAAYPLTKTDLYAAFYERATDLTKCNGFIGALTSRTFMHLSSLQELRQLLLEKIKPITMADLGFGILDGALVSTCASVFGGTSENHREKYILIPGVFFRLTEDENDREVKLKQALKQIVAGQLHPSVFTASINDFKMLPNSPIAYWVSQNIRRVFADHQLLSSFATVKAGLCTGADAVFVRHWWEVKVNHVHTKKWVTFAKGGDYSKYYSDVDLVVNWTDNGQEMLDWPGARIQNSQYYFREAVNYVYVTVKGFNARYLPGNHIFGHASRSIIFDNANFLWPTLGITNSSFVQFLLDLITDGRKYETGHILNLPFRTGVDQQTTLGSLAQKSYTSKSIWDNGNETCTHFTRPWLLQAAKGELRLPDLTGFENLSGLPPTLPALVDYLQAVAQAADARLQALQAEIDQAVYDLYEITPEDRALIERELGRRPPEVVWPYAEKLSREQKAAEHVARLMSFCLLQAIQADPDGILPLSAASGHATALELLRRGLEKEFGEAAAYQVENDAARYLGRPLEEWLERDFWKDYHVKWYKRRPILWQVGSARGTFSAFLYIHKLSRDTLPRLRTLYLWPARNAVQAALENAHLREQGGERGAGKEVARLEAALEDLQDFETRLLNVIEGRVKCAIPEWAQGPFRNGMYDPVLDDGVAVNIAPLQEAGVLVKKII